MNTEKTKQSNREITSLTIAGSIYDRPDAYFIYLVAKLVISCHTVLISSIATDIISWSRNSCNSTVSRWHELIFISDRLNVAAPNRMINNRLKLFLPARGFWHGV